MDRQILDALCAIKDPTFLRSPRRHVLSSPFPLIQSAKETTGKVLEASSVKVCLPVGVLSLGCLSSETERWKRGSVSSISSAADTVQSSECVNVSGREPAGEAQAQSQSEEGNDCGVVLVQEDRDKLETNVERGGTNTETTLGTVCDSPGPKEEERIVQEDKEKEKLEGKEMVDSSVNSAQDQRKITVLCDWTLLFIPKTGSVCLEGTNESIGDRWKSTSIEVRLDSKRVVTKRGSVYVLDGPIDRSSMLEEGFPRNLIRAFCGGFPENWRQLIQEHSNSLKSLQGLKLKKVETEGVGGVGCVKTPLSRRPPTVEGKRCRRHKKRSVQRLSGRVSGCTTSDSSFSDSFITVTSSGRCVRPVLNFWCNERTYTDKEGNTVVRNGSPNLLGTYSIAVTNVADTADSKNGDSEIGETGYGIRTRSGCLYKPVGVKQKCKSKSQVGRHEVATHMTRAVVDGKSRLDEKEKPVGVGKLATKTVRFSCDTLGDERQATRHERLPEEEEEDDSSDDEWSDLEIQRLNRAMFRLPPGTAKFWDHVADYVGRTSQECQTKQFGLNSRKRQRPTQRTLKSARNDYTELVKAAAAGQPVKLAGVGTLKRRRQLLALLENEKHAEAELDLFDTTPFRNKMKRRKSRSNADCDLWSEEDKGDSSLSMLLSPGGFHFPGAPTSATPCDVSFAVDSPPPLPPGGKERLDAYVHKNVQRRKKRSRVVQIHRSKVSQQKTGSKSGRATTGAAAQQLAKVLSGQSFDVTPISAPNGSSEESEDDTGSRDYYWGMA